MRAAQGGTYLSAMRGRGMEYAESRQYQAGDDVRHLDWRVMARRGEAHTKIFQEERERPVVVVVDDRAPMHFATQGVFKRVRAAEAAAIVAWKAADAGDRVGAMVFDAFTHHEQPPQRGRRGATHLLNLLCTPARLGSLDAEALSSSLLSGFDRLRRMVKPGSLVFVFSDFRGLNDACAAELARVRRHCDVVLGAFSDPFEQRLPDGLGHGTLAVHNAFGRSWLDLGDADRNRGYEARASAHAEAISALARRMNAPLMQFSTTDAALPEIRRMLNARR